MTIYKNRYQAGKDCQYGEKIIKVSGGYIIMKEQDYYIWKNQK